MRSCIRYVKDTSGQASVEAAFLLPVLFFLLALLLQPLCIFYTRAVMSCAAAEGVRLVSTMPLQGEENAYERFVKRRLSAVPPLDIFHVGGADSWKVELAGGEDTKEATVSIATEVKPLPLLGVLALPFTGAGGTISLVVEESAHVRPEWLGGDYDSWISAWTT